MEKIKAVKRRRELELPRPCQFIVDASPMPIACVQGKDHIIRYANPAFCLLAGEAETELIGDSFSNAVPGSSELLSFLDRIYRTGEAETYTRQDQSYSTSFYWSCAMWPVLTADGRGSGIMIQVTETTPFHQHAAEMNQALMISAVRQHELTEAAETLNLQLREEITHRKHAEEEIKASERQYRGLIEAIPQIVWTATPKGILDFANSKWFEYLGIDLDTFNQTGWPILLHPEDKDRSLAAWSRGLQSGSAFQIEHRLKNISNGSLRWYLSRAAPIRAEGGSVIKWLGTSTDVEDHKRAEMAVFTKQKLESLGLLAGGIAHDFNNLLVGILSGASLAAEVLPASHSLQKTLADITLAGERAAHLTRQMLAYAGKGRFLIEKVDISGLVRSTCDLIQASIPKKVRLTLQIREDLPPVEADSGQMQQVVMNLIMNAAESIDESKGGSVTVKTDLAVLASAPAEKADLATGSLASGAYVVVEIQDTGSGMDETTKARIFDPFFTTKFTGRGLGLSAVEGIIRTQQGALEVRSALGSGSTFRVFLPASSELGHESATPGKSPRAFGAGTILVVDDEEMVRRVVKASLQQSGFAVRLADGGEEAIRILLNKAENPISLILLDLSMPGMSGKQVMQQIRILGIQIPILICSGYNEEEVQREFSGLDIAGCVQKPFTARQLANRVSSALYPEQLPK